MTDHVTLHIGGSIFSFEIKQREKTDKTTETISQTDGRNVAGLARQWFECQSIRYYVKVLTILRYLTEDGFCLEHG
jgi:hypothetical protein